MIATQTSEAVSKSQIKQSTNQVPKDSKSAKLVNITNNSSSAKIQTKTSTSTKSATVINGGSDISSSNSTKTKTSTTTATTSSSSDSGDAGASQPDSWSQNQQVILEWALKQHPKGIDQRWEKIAACIPGKTKVQ